MSIFFYNVQMIALLDDTHFSAIGISHPHMTNGDLNSKFNNTTIILLYD